MTAPIYMPILKGRRGELGALRELGPRDALVPVIEVPRIPWDFRNECPKRTVSDHTKKFIQDLERAFRVLPPRSVVDGYFLEDEGAEQCGRALHTILKRAEDRNVSLTPATGLERATPYTQTAARYARRVGTGWVVRIEREDLFDSAYLRDSLKDLLDRARVPASSTDLVIDLKELQEEHEAADLDLLLAAVPHIPHLNSWRSLWVSGGAFPEFLTGVPPRSEAFLPRLEWTLWNGVARGLRGLRVPKFSDYGVAHPISPEVDFRIMRMSANIRYTTEHSWLVVKGSNTKDYGYKQFHTLCRSLRARAEYCGAAFSWGDEYVANCADNVDGPGNAEKWRKVGTNHHIEFVLRQADEAKRLLGESPG